MKSGLRKLLRLLPVLLILACSVSGAETDGKDESDSILSAKEALFGDLSTSAETGEITAPEDESGTVGEETKSSGEDAGEDGGEVGEGSGNAGEDSGDAGEDTGEPEEEGILSVPDHPLSVTAEKLVFIGDSRTVDMMNAVQDDSIWCCKVSMGYNWMVTEGVPAVDGYIDANTAVIILLGVNDPHNISNYIGYTNEKAAEWAARGATTYFVSVGPVTNDPYVTNAEIEYFNAALQANLSGVYYIDIYSYLMANGYSTTDGTHYPANVSIAIYNYIVDNLEENRVGIWG